MTTTGPILFHNTMRIAEGRLAEFSQAVRQAVEFVEQHGPQLMVQVFVDEPNRLAHSFQLYPDSAAVLAHWEMSDPYIQEVMRHCTVESFETYGELSDAVITGLTQGLAGPPALRPPLTGFHRMAAN